MQGRAIRAVWRAGVRLACAALLAALPLLALAQRVEGERAQASGLYQAEVPVRSQTEAERDAGLARALAQVLGKLTGDRGVAARPGVREELARAKDYLAGFDYRQDEGMSASGVPTFQTMLVARFRPDAVDDLVDMLGLPVWPEPRPKPVLWLAIDDGSGPRLVGLGQVNAARSILDAAKARGYALGLPAGNAAEQAAVGAIWRGDIGAIATLSARYSPPMQLVGKLYRSNGGWQADWQFVDRGKLLAKWSNTHPDARRAMAGGAEGAADALFKRYARAGSGAAPASVRVRIEGLASGDDYLRVVGCLNGLSSVRALRPLTASPQALELELDLAGGLPGFNRLLARTGLLQPLEAAAGAVPTYRLVHP